MKRKMVELLLLVLAISAFAENYPGTSIDLDNIKANNSRDIVAILNGNIFYVFYNDLKTYETELQQKNFLETDEAQVYQEKIEELKNIIQTQGITTVYEQRKAQFSDYDIENRGFWVTIGDSYNDGDNISLNNFLCDKVEIYTKKSAITYYMLFIPVPEDVAGKIEHNNNIILKQEMKISDIGIFTVVANGWKFTDPLPIAETLKFIIYDKATNEVITEVQY